MSTFRVYINPKDDFGAFTGYQEVTEDVIDDSLSKIAQQIDSDEYNVGVFNYNSFSVKLRNDHGKYSDVEVIQSIFRERRGGSKVQVRWQVQDHRSICGVAIAGKCKISPEIIVYDGLLNDDASRLDIDDQIITFKVLNSDSVFDEVETPFSDLNIGDLFSEAILTVLDQSDITKIMTVSASNINVGLDVAIDAVADLENTTVKEALDILLFGSNSVMYLRDNIIYIKSRDGGATVQKTFIGQASNDGIEDIQKLSSISTGRNKVFNFWTWKDTTLSARDTASISANGLRKKEISFSTITNTTKRQSILDAQRDQFMDLKQEFKLTTFLTYENLGLNMLDRVSVDYPTVVSEGNPGSGVPVYGLAVYGEAVYPNEESSITIDKDTPYKIMGINIEKKNQLITFRLKEI